MPLREGVVLDPLEAPDRLAGEPAHLGELAGDGQRLGPHAVLDRLADGDRKRGLDPRGELSELLHLRPRALERRIHVARLST